MCIGGPVPVRLPQVQARSARGQSGQIVHEGEGSRVRVERSGMIFQLKIQATIFYQSMVTLIPNTK